MCSYTSSKVSVRELDSTLSSSDSLTHTELVSSPPGSTTSLPESCSTTRMIENRASLGVVILLTDTWIKTKSEGGGWKSS